MPTWKIRLRLCLLPVLALLLVAPGASADPPVLPPTPPPEVPCRPLICLQLTDARELAPDHWEIEFRALNWTAFTDRTCPATDPSCIDRSSPGTAAEGLVFVRSAALSTVPFAVRPVDPNGAPLGSETVSERTTVRTFADGSSGIDLDSRFVARVVRLLDDASGDEIPAACYELEDPVEGIVRFDDGGLCAAIVSPLVDVEAELELHSGSQEVVANSWTSSLCTADQIIWSQDPTVDPPLSIPPGDSNVQPSCPVTCEEKTSLGNTLDGFVVEVEDFVPGERLVFNWYLLGPGGPIASGAPPTPSDRGTLGPSFGDPWGFSFGSYQLDRKPSCTDGSCDTVLVSSPSVTDPSLNCLVGSGLDRGELPFDVYVSLGPAGSDPPCSLAPDVVVDERGLERLVVRATAGGETDRITVTFTNRATGRVDKVVREPLSDASLEIPSSDLVGLYTVGGTCENTVTRRFFILDEIELAVPRRGDLAEVASATTAFEIEPGASGASFALTGGFPLADLDLDVASLDVYHFFQLRDGSGATRIVGSATDPETLERNGGLLVRDLAGPSLVCPAAVTLGTDSDGGGDCAVEVSATATARDDAGGFFLGNDLEPGRITRSFGTTVGGPEEAVQTVARSITVGTDVGVTFQTVDDAGASASCVSTLSVVDDTVPVVDCRLVPTDSGNGRGNNAGGNGNGQGNPGGNGPPGQQPSSNFFVVDFTVGDNCTAEADLAVTADIDGISVSDGQTVQISTNSGNGTTANLVDGVLHIQTSGEGLLTVTATDEAGLLTRCEDLP